jgi:D-3-phosphoglycerate dehydrogenase
LSLRGDAEFLKDVRATAEHTVALTLALLRFIPSAFDDVRSGGWNRDGFKGRELYGKTAGIVGYGRLGRIVARYLQVFGVHVMAADPAPRNADLETGVSLVPLQRLLEASDLVSLHVNLTQETAGFFGASQFRAMKQGAWFINTARGELIDESALLEALASKRLAGAALDVLCNEHCDGVRHNPLIAWARENDNLIITPHLGGCTSESMEKTEIHLSRRLISILNNGGDTQG